MSAARSLEGTGRDALTTLVDLEAEPPPPGESGAAAESVNALCSLAAELMSFDRALSQADEAQLLALAPPLAGAVKRAIALLRTLEHVTRSPQVDTEFELALEQPTWVSKRRSEPPAPSLSDVCFVGILELGRLSDELLRAESPDDFQVAAETALRKLRRTTHAVLDAARVGGLPEPPSGQRLRQGAFDLEGTLAVRRLYANLRRDLQRPELESQTVLMRLRYAAGAMATLVSSVEYATARASDRALLRGLHERILLWAHGRQAEDDGLQLLKDVVTSADLLRGINRRQELRSHDCALIRQLLVEPVVPAAAWLARLAPLYGLDDELDVLVEQTQRAPNAAGIAVVRARLLELQHP